jgi:hypothetical protein
LARALVTLVVLHTGQLSDESSSDAISGENWPKDTLMVLLILSHCRFPVIPSGIDSESFIGAAMDRVLAARDLAVVAESIVSPKSINCKQGLSKYRVGIKFRSRMFAISQIY